VSKFSQLLSNDINVLFYLTTDW